MTKSELANRAGISVSFLSDLTNGKANPSLKIMGLIAEALDMPLPMLLELNESEPGDVYVPRSLPDGFVRVSGVLTEFQAFNVSKWNRENCNLLQKKL